MHYIRFLKPPQIAKGILQAKLTITTDLGDEFLNADLPLQLRIIETGSGKHESEVGDPSKPNVVHWTGGMRELSISIPLPTSQPKGSWRLQVWPWLGGLPPVARSAKQKNKAGRFEKKAVVEHEDFIQSFSSVLRINRQEGEVKYPGMVLAAKSTSFESDKQAQKLPAEIERVFDMDDPNEQELVISEETGHSIARHIWDAGVVFSALIWEMGMAYGDATQVKYLRLLHGVLKQGQDKDRAKEDQMNILELGTGCAIVAATIEVLYPYTNMLATDMPEATEIATRNIRRNKVDEDFKPAPSNFGVLDWTKPLPPNVAEQKWDLILVADCTYNSDVVPDLVNTLKKLVDRSPEVLIAVALKWRHDSEAVFHELMRERGLKVVDRHTERVGNFDVEATGKEEEIEVYLFKGDEKEKNEKEADRGRKRKLSDEGEGQIKK